MRFHVKKCIAAVLLCGPLALAGCQTTDLGEMLRKAGEAGGAQAAETASVETGAETEKRVSWDLYTPFYDQGDHLKDLVTKDRNLDDAGKLYLEQKPFFTANKAKQQAMLDLLAEGLNAPKLAGLRDALAGLDGLDWPAPAAKWPEIAKTIGRADAAVQSYPSHEILNEPDFRASEADRLEKALARVKARIERDAPGEFESFDHFGQGSFFAVYPVDLDKWSFMAANFAAIEPKLTAAGTKQLNAFAANYPKDVVKAENWGRLGGLYVAASLKEAGPESAADLVSVLAAINGAKEAGFAPKKVPGLKIAFVEVTSKTLLKKRQIEFPASIVMDLPAEAIKADLDEALSGSKTKNADFLIIFDVALAKTSRRVTSTSKIPSKILVGYRKEPNPDYNIVQNEVNNARMKVNEAAMNAASTNAQYCYGIGCLGKAIAQVAAGAAKGAANTALQEAMVKLSATPQYIDKPLYEKYRFNKAKTKANKTMTVHYYIVDQRKRTYFKSTFDITENETFYVAYGVQDDDPDKNEHIKTADTENDVVEWEEAPSTVKLSQLTDHYLKNIGETKPLPKLAALREEMLRDKNIALTKYKEQTYWGSTQKDPRFDSVVVIYTMEGSLGSGFFVRPDIVMTNYHVVRELNFVEMKMYGGQETFGKVIAKDVRLDLALVKVQARGKPVEFYDKNKLDLGSTVEVIGHPRRFEFAITRGVVSAVRRMDAPNIKTSKKVLQVQIDAATSPGNSGGPVFLKNKVVSVVSWGRVDTGSENLNFTIHYSEALRFMNESLDKRS